MEKVQGNTISVKTIFLLFFLSLFVMACKKNNYNEHIITSKMKNDSLKQILEKQIKAGAEEEYGSFEDYNKNDLDVLVQIENNILKQNGYKPINGKDFIKRIEEIFHRKIDYSYTSEYLRINVDDKCDKELKYNPLNSEYQDIYISKKYKFITNFYTLPTIIDYIKLYPELQSIEKEPIEIESDGEKLNVTRWKDVPNLDQQRYYNHQQIIHRNKYLFNDNRASLAWLLSHDKGFLKRLVIDFGYDKSEEINKFVLEDLYKEYSSPIHRTEKLGEIFFTKDCQGKLQIQEGLLKYVNENTTKDDDRFIYALGNYLHYLFKEDKQGIFDEDPSKKFNIEEKAKIVAYVANIESPAFYKYKPLNSDTAWHKAGTSLYNITAGHPEILKIIEKNNYYGLNDLKEVLKSESFELEKEGANKIFLDKEGNLRY